MNYEINHLFCTKTLVPRKMLKARLFVNDLLFYFYGMSEQLIFYILLLANITFSKSRSLFKYKSSSFIYIIHHSTSNRKKITLNERRLLGCARAIGQKR